MTIEFMDPEPNHIDFLGLQFNNLGAKAVTQWVVSQAGQERFAYLVTPNVDHMVRLHNDPQANLRPAYDNADLTICDSRILAKLANLSNIAMPALPGSDLTRDLLDNALTKGRLAVIGGSPDLYKDIIILYPQFDWVFHEPPMGVRHNIAARQAIAKFVEEANADLIFFAIGSPQSEICCAEIKKHSHAKGVALCIGASLEFLTGEKQRAPIWMQRLGLEWLFRLLSEPTRLWRRYLVEGPRIFAIWWRWRKHKS